MKKLFSFLRSDQIKVDLNDIARYCTEQTKTYQSNFGIVLLPETADELSKIVTQCYQHHIAMIPLGGRTGLTGATVGNNQEVGIAFDRMNRIIDIDQIGFTVEAEAGVILEELQYAVSQKEMYFPLDYAAKGSCQIGGSVSTNAGGINVLKYGMTRDLVLGLEIVLSDGSILNLNHSLIKDNSGYKLIQLFIGAEGSLGFISKVTFKCFPQNKYRRVMYFGSNDFNKLPELLRILRTNSFDVIAFECISRLCHDSVLAAMPQLKSPFRDPYNYYILVEFNEADDEKIIRMLEDGIAREYISDAVLAQDKKEEAEFKSLREAVSDALYLLGAVHANDISVPISSLSSFLNDLNQLFLKSYSQYKLGVFGHIGDGNLHIYIIKENEKDTHRFHNEMDPCDQELFRLVESYRGSISAEHGIGLLKKEALHYRRSSLEIDLMRKIKQIFDPKLLLNTGKIFDVENFPK